jgi:hypothetical protein
MNQTSQFEMDSLAETFAGDKSLVSNKVVTMPPI